MPLGRRGGVLARDVHHPQDWPCRMPVVPQRGLRPGQRRSAQLPVSMQPVRIAGQDDDPIFLMRMVQRVDQGRCRCDAEGRRGHCHCHCGPSRCGRCGPSRCGHCCHGPMKAAPAPLAWRRLAVIRRALRPTFDRDDDGRMADNALINWSFLIACQPLMPWSLASWARCFLLQSLSASTVIRYHSDTPQRPLGLVRGDCNAFDVNHP